MGDVDALAIWNEEDETVTLFAVNRDFEEENLISLNLKDFPGYVPVEHISMAGFDLDAVNTKDASPVRPKHTPLAPVYKAVQEFALAPLSWNVIRLKKQEN